MVVPSDRIPALLKWNHESSCHVGANRTLKLLTQWFHSMWTDNQLQKTLQPIVDKCPCLSCNLEMSGKEVSIGHSVPPTQPTVFLTWTTPRCLTLGSTTLP